LRSRFLEHLLKIQKVERGSIWIRQQDRYVCIESHGGQGRIDVIKGAAINRSTFDSRMKKLGIRK
jgi:hypothetical protein